MRKKRRRRTGFRLRPPVSTENRALSLAAKGDEWHFALHGGEDYELLFTAPRERAAALVEMLGRETGTSVAIIGEVQERARGTELELPDGRTVPLEPRGWDHLKAGPRENAQ